MIWDKPDLLVLSGSNLYGYATPESDEDLLGFVMPPLSVELGLINRFEQKNPSKEDLEAGDDKKVYSFKNFISHLAKNDTQCLEILFAPRENIKVCSEIGQKMIDVRHMFVSKHLFRRFSGYAYAEFRKVRGVALVPLKQTPTEQQIIDQIKNKFMPDKKQMDDILNLLYQNREKIEISVFRKLGKQRKESIEKYGYSVKNAAHCIRLLMEGTEMLSTGNLRYPFSPGKVQLLRDIRAGKPKFKEIEETYNHWQEEIKKAMDDSTLPEKTDMEKINQLFIDLTTEAYRKSLYSEEFNSSIGDRTSL